ncbi:MAG: PD-(D/E)XK nuclease domain-containing protein [Gammaproteobacteria bacterium]
MELHTGLPELRSGNYASVFYSYLVAIGLDVVPEDASLMGRVDVGIALDGVIYLIEFKVVDDKATGEAMAQLKTKDYAAKYRAKSQLIYLVEVEISKPDRQIVGFEWQRDAEE